ncbi:hypothetical protein [Reyranella sp.]|uniref:hypothetical protein n=1 Tax=Reyranella sp. TaxID=1929291 RepID=UPI003D0CB010
MTEARSQAETRALAGTERTALSALMDRLVPPIDDLPGAGTMGLLADVEAMAGRHAPYRRALLHIAGTLGTAAFSGLDGAAQDAAIEQFETAEPAIFEAVRAMVYLAYYGNERVHRRIGWCGGPLQPRGFDLPPFDEAALATARKRPRLWRQV